MAAAGVRARECAESVLTACSRRRQTPPPPLLSSATLLLCGPLWAARMRPRPPAAVRRPPPYERARARARAPSPVAEPPVARAMGHRPRPQIALLVALHSRLRRPAPHHLPRAVARRQCGARAGHPPSPSPPPSRARARQKNVRRTGVLPENPLQAKATSNSLRHRFREGAAGARSRARNEMPSRRSLARFGARRALAPTPVYPPASPARPGLYRVNERDLGGRTVFEPGSRPAGASPHHARRREKRPRAGGF